MNNLVLTLLNKHQNFDKKYLHKLLEIYKIILLYKTKTASSDKLS
jgi:hypothetical protein